MPIEEFCEECIAGMLSLGEPDFLLNSVAGKVNIPGARSDRTIFFNLSRLTKEMGLIELFGLTVAWNGGTAKWLVGMARLGRK